MNAPSPPITPGRVKPYLSLHLLMEGSLTPPSKPKVYFPPSRYNLKFFREGSLVDMGGPKLHQQEPSAHSIVRSLPPLEIECNDRGRSVRAN